MLEDPRNIPPDVVKPAPVVVVAEGKPPEMALPVAIGNHHQATPANGNGHAKANGNGRTWSDALTTEVFIRKFRNQQDGFLFHPHEDGVQPLKRPSDYPELQGLGIKERTLVTERKYNLIPPSVARRFETAKPDVTRYNGKEIDPEDLMFIPPDASSQSAKPGFVGRVISSVNSSLPATASITLWEREAEKGKPHLIFFTGRTGHVADTGEISKQVEGYNRHASLDFLSDLAKQGVGFTVVTMRGYGNNRGKPGEDGFRQDIAVFVDDWLKRKDKVPADRVVVAGYSLGAANAAIMATELTKRGEAPAVLALANGFSSMIRRGKEFIDDYLSTTDNPKLKGLQISEEVVRKRMLAHPFNTLERLTELKPQTHVCIGYSTHDEVTNPDHSRQLANTAREYGLAVFEHCFENCGHLNVPTDKLAGFIMDAYNHSQSPQGRERADDRLQRRTRDGVFVPQRFIKVAAKKADASQQENGWNR